MRIEAERWLKSCHDISPQQTECATALLNLYEETGSKEDVLDQLQIILRAKVQQRYLFNNYKHYPCDVATHAIRVLSMFAIHNDSFTRDDVRCCLHLVSVLSVQYPTTNYYNIYNNRLRFPTVIHARQWIEIFHRI